jgi:hypothetical protein
MNDDIESRMAAAWREAADRLGIRVTAPYEVASVSYAAFLPDFGGDHGAVVARLLSSKGSIAAADVAGLYLSRVSDEYAAFDADLFKATLDDWGWFGPAEDRPAWYTGKAWTS